MALFVHHPECSIQSANGVIDALTDICTVKLFSHGPVEDHFFDNVDIVAFPGGIGDSDTYHKLVELNKPVIQRFINRGGAYLGICMGAYWAGHHYLDLLTDVQAEQYIKRPNTTIRRSYSTVAEVDWQGEAKEMFFYDGCALVGDETKFRTVARYANGDPMAIIQNRIGAIGCHPESHQFWYNKPYLETKWHCGEHHKLLQYFVQELVK